VKEQPLTLEDRKSSITESLILYRFCRMISIKAGCVISKSIDTNDKDVFDFREKSTAANIP